MKKRGYLSLALLGFLAISLFGCGSNNSEAKQACENGNVPGEWKSFSKCSPTDPFCGNRDEYCQCPDGYYWAGAGVPPRAEGCKLVESNNNE